MAITTKQTLSNKKFRQSTLDELNLDGKVIIGGEFFTSYKNITYNITL